MKLRIMVLTLLGVTGVGASFALAGSAKHNGPCRVARVLGTVSGSPSFSVTMQASREHGTVKPSQVVKVALGGGQSVRFAGVGCLGSDGTVTVREAILHVAPTFTPGGDGDHKPPTTTTTSTSSTPGTTTTRGDGDHKPPTTTTTPNL